MRIALVSMHTSPLETPGHGDAGGMNVYIAEAASALVRRGHRVEIFTRATAADQIGSVRQDDGVLVHRIIAGPCAPVRKDRLAAHVREFAIGLSDFGPFDVVHSHYWLSGLAVLASEWTAPHVITFHTTARAKASTDASGQEAAGRADAEQLLCERAALVCAVSHADAASLRSDYAVPVDRLVVGLPGVDGALFRRRGAKPRGQWRVLQRIPADAFLVTTAGRIQPLKAQGLLAEAVARVDRGLGVFGVAIGDPTPGEEGYVAALRQRIRGDDLSGRFALHPAVSRPQLARWFSISQLAAIPSHSESFGLTSLEAQACGVPVLARATGGLPETMIDGVTGVLLRDGDPQDWADAITRLAARPRLRTAMASAAHAFARERSWDDLAAHLDDFYTSLD